MAINLFHLNGVLFLQGKGRIFVCFKSCVFYPAHFLVLAAIRELMEGCSAYELYVTAHVIALLVSLWILLVVLCARPSRGQIGTTLLVLSACIYTFGFTVEITSGNIGGFYAATLVQYFGECLLMIAFTLFISEYS